MSSKKYQFDFKKHKSKIIWGFLVLAFLFLVFVLVLYTPWVQNSYYMEIYRTKKMLKTLPPSSPLRSFYQGYLQCLEQGEEDNCQYGYESSGNPVINGQ